jgi:hypothetical protein
MAEKLKRDSTDTDYEETTAPQNPPNSMLKERARTGWLASSLGTLLIFFIVVAAAFGWVLVRHELGKDARISPDPQVLERPASGSARTRRAGLILLPSTVARVTN